MYRLKFLFIAFLLVFASCEDSPTFKNNNRRIGPSVSGEIGKLLVVCEKPLWNSEFKTSLDSSLTQFIMPYYPDVATFMLFHKTPAHFEKGVKRYRSILFVNLDPNFKAPNVSVEKRMDVWAIDQLVIDITAKDENQLIEFCKNGGLLSVHKEFDTMEWRRIMNYFKEGNNKTIDDKLAKQFGIKLSMPQGAQLLNQKDDFMRIEFPVANRAIEFSNAGSQDKGAIFSGIMVYQTDLTDNNQFSLETLIAERDSILEIYAPYQIEGMYMGTQFAPLVYPEIDPMKNFNGTLSGTEMRGMFVYVGRPIHATGGAFWAFHFKHPKRNKLITVSGYLDAPSTASWVHQLREIQAVLKSVELTN